MKLEVELEGLDLEGFDFFGMAVDIPFSDAGGGSEKELAGSTEIDAEVFGDEEFKYECPKCGFRFQLSFPGGVESWRIWSRGRSMGIPYFPASPAAADPLWDTSWRALR